MTADTGARFDPVAVAAIVLLTVGAVLGNGVLFVAAAVPAVYLIAEAVASPPDPDAVTVERSIADDTVAPDRRTTVTVAVTNGGDRPIPDLRIADRPPNGVSVADGAPRACLSVRPGESASFAYDVVASHGDHAFGDPVVRARSLSGVGAATATRPAGGDGRLACRRTDAAPPVRSVTRGPVGRQPSDTAGDGVAFHSLREYRHGDDVRRVDWRRFARTGELATVKYREAHASGTAVVVDARRPGRVGREADGPTAAALAADAAEQLVVRLADDGNRVGVAALGLAPTDVDAPVTVDRADRPWVAIGGGETTRRRAAAVLDAAAAVGSERTGATTDGGHEAARPAALRQRLPASAAVVLASPLLDDEPVVLAEALTAAGHPVLVVSPDVTDAASVGRRVVAAGRRLRLERLRTAGIEVVDWDAEEPLALAMEGSA